MSPIHHHPLTLCAFRRLLANAQPCPFYAKGQCRDGNNCKFSHAAGAQQGQQAAIKPAQVAPAFGGNPAASQVGNRLTGGDILKIHNEWMPTNPRLQIVSIKKSAGVPSAIFGTAASHQYWVALSDGVHKQLNAMLDTVLHRFVENDQVAKFGIIELERYICKKVDGRRVIVVLDAKILDRSTGAVIGDPRTLKADGTSTAELLASNDAPVVTGRFGAPVAAAPVHVPLPPSLESSIIQQIKETFGDDPGASPVVIGVMVKLLGWMIPRFAAKCVKSAGAKVTMADVKCVAKELFGSDDIQSILEECEFATANVVGEDSVSLIFPLKEFRAYPGLAKNGARPTPRAAAYFTAFLEGVNCEILDITTENMYLETIGADDIKETIASNEGYEAFFGTATTTAHIFSATSTSALPVDAATRALDDTGSAVASDSELPFNEAFETLTERPTKLVKVGVLTARDGNTVEVTFFVDGIKQAVQKVPVSDALLGGAVPHFIIPSANAWCIQHVHSPEVPEESLQTSVLEIDLALVPAVNELSDSFSDNPLAWVSGSSPALARCVLRGADRMQLIESIKVAVAEPPVEASGSGSGAVSVSAQPVTAAPPGTTASTSDAELLQIPLSGPVVDAGAVLSSGAVTVWSAYTRAGLPELDGQWCHRGSGLAMIARQFDSTERCWLVLPTIADGTATRAFLALPRFHSRQFLSTTLTFASNPTQAGKFELSYKVVFDDVGAASCFATTWTECSAQLAEHTRDGAAAASKPSHSDNFIPKTAPTGIMIGYVFKDGDRGRGYYRDAETQSSYLQPPVPLSAPAEVNAPPSTTGTPLSMQRVNAARFNMAAEWLSKHEELTAMRALKEHHSLRRKLADQLVSGCLKHLAMLPVRAVVDSSTELLAVVSGFSPSTFPEPDSDARAAAADLMRHLVGAGLLTADAGVAPLLDADDAVAATKIQSWYRGVLIRRCLESVCALQYNSVCSVGQVRKLLTTVVEVGTSGYTTVRREIEAVLRSRAKTQKTDLATQKKDKRLVQATAVKTNPKTGLLSDALKLSPGKLSEYCFLRTTLDTVIGLNNVKQWITDELNDAAQRSLLGETNSSARHILLKGGLGSGKHTAARMIARMYKLILPEAPSHDDEYCGCASCVKDRSLGLGHSAAFVSHASDEEAICKKPNSFNLHFRHVKAKELDCIKNAVLFYRVGDGDTFDGRENDVWSKHLDDCAKANCVVILGGDPFAVETYFAIDAFQRWSPHVLQCESLTTMTLAQLMLQQIEDRGYMLSKNELLVEDPNDLEQMTKIVTLKFAGSEIRQRNAYLAKDTVEHAISRKHAREDQGVGQSLQSLPSQFLLCAADFGVQIVVRQSEAAVQIEKIQAVEAEIEALVGMENGKEWFRRFKAKADYVIKTNDRTALRTCLVRVSALLGCIIEPFLVPNGQ